MNIAIIPARGGSKRLPGKNIKNLAGKPMIAWTIEAALDSGVFDHVFVSTDDQSIAKISQKFGAEVPFLRPAELASDTATTNEVVTHLVEWFEEEYNIAATNIAILQPTSPLRDSIHIREAANLMKKKSVKAVVSVCELEYPMQLCNNLGVNGSMDGFIKPENLKRTQDLATYYRLNGALYFFERDYVNNLSNLYSEGTYSYIMASRSSIDIDTKEDFKLAEFFMTSEV